MKKFVLDLALVTAVSLPMTAPAVMATASAKEGAGHERVFDQGIFDLDHWQFRLRGIGVLPDAGGSTTIGGTPDADHAVVPEFDITYFFTKHVAAELILATSKHDVTLRDSVAGTLDLGSTWILPPTLTLQYHFTPDEAFSPYVGAGINLTLPYNTDNGADVAALDVDSSVGFAVQAGFDYWINDNWGVNFDVKKLWLDVDASVNGGAITGEVNLDPWIVGAGISFRF